MSYVVYGQILDENIDLLLIFLNIFINGILLFLTKNLVYTSRMKLIVTGELFLVIYHFIERCHCYDPLIIMGDHNCHFSLK